MIDNNPSQFIIYQSEDGQTKLDVRFVGETVWLTQALMAELFQTSRDNISLHLKNIFTDGELDEISTTEDFSVVRQEGSRQLQRQLKHYNLDAIISVGYRVQSHTATRFRQWATRHWIPALPFSKRCKIKCTGQLRAIPPLRLFMTALIATKPIWA